MWFNQKSSYFLDTFGNRSRYLSKLKSGNSEHTRANALANHIAGKQSGTFLCNHGLYDAIIPKYALRAITSLRQWFSTFLLLRPIFTSAMA